MDPKEIAHLVSIYQKNPSQFDYDQANQLQTDAGSYGIPMQRSSEAEDFDLISTAKQAVYGVVKGGTGIFDPGLNDRPRNTVEEYAKSIGELGGFLGLMFVPVGAVAKGVGMGARVAGMVRLESVAGTISKAVEGASLIKSVPILAGEKLIGAVGVERAAAAAAKLGGVFGGSEAAIGIAHQVIKGGLRMAGAGAVSAVTLFDGKTLGETVHDVVSGGMYGMMFGGAMDAIPANALSSIPWMKESTSASMFIKTILGSVTNAVPAIVGGADGYRIAYEAAVGAFFGSKSVDWKENGFHDVYSEHDKGNWGMATLSNPDALRFFEGRGDAHREYQDFIEKLHNPSSRGNIIRYLESQFYGSSGMGSVIPEDKVHEISNLGYTKFGMGDRFTDGTGVFTEVSRKVTEDGTVTHITGRSEDGIELDFPVRSKLEIAEEPLPDTNNALPSEPQIELSRKASAFGPPSIIEQPFRIGDLVDETDGRGNIVKKAVKIIDITPSGEYVKTESGGSHIAASWVKPAIQETPITKPASLKNVVEPVEDTGVLAGGRLALGGPLGAFRKMAITINDIRKGTPESSENVIRAHTNNLWKAVMEHAVEYRKGGSEGKGVGFDALLNTYVNHPSLVAKRGGKELTANDLRPLLPMWNSLTQRINHEHMSWNAKLGKLVPYSQASNSSMAINGGGDPVDTSGPRNFIHVITGDDKATITIAGYTDAQGNYSDLNKADLTHAEFNKINDQLMERGYYLFSGGADKAMLVGVKFQDSGMNKEDITNLYAKHLEEMDLADPKHHYRSDHQKLMAASGMEPETYKRIFVNNLLLYERINNMSITEAMKSEGMIKKVVDFNKRMQPLLTNFYQLDTDVLAHFTKGEKLNYNLVLVRDDSTKKDGNGRPTENTDGTTTVHSRNLKAHGQGMGVPDGESHLKSFILHYSERAGRGMLINKHGEQTATPEMDQMLDSADLGYVSRVSGSKQYGNRTVYRMRIEHGKLEFSEGGYDEPFVPVDRSQMDVTTLESKDFRISSTIHDDTIASMNHAITYPKQAIYHQSIYETGEAAIKAHMNWIIEKFHGEEKLNARLAEYVKTDARMRKPGELSKLLEEFDSLGVQHVLNAMVSDPQIGKKIFQKIIGVATNSEDGLYTPVNDGEGIEDIPDGLNGVKRLIAYTAEHNILYSRLGRKITEQAMTRFVVNRLTRPKVKSAGHSTMHGNGQDMVVHINRESPVDRLTTENFFLDNGKKNMKIEGVIYSNSKKGGVKKGWTTLELQHKSFLKAEERYNRAMAANDNDVTKIDPKVRSDYEEMGNALDFAVSRVPIDSFSGSVRLRFAGFTGLDGGAILLHGNIKEQLGGADNDGDTAYYYHGLPREYLNALDAAKGNFQKYAQSLAKRGEKYGTDEKRIFFTDGGGIYKELKESQAGTFDPIFRAMVGHAVSKGRGNMLPIAVKYVDLMKKLLDTAYSKKGVLTLSSPEYSIHLTARDFDGQKGTGETLGAYGQRAINSAADAGKESGMVTSDQMQAILLASAFKKIEISDGEGNRTTLFDAEKQDFNRDNHEELLKGLLNVVSRDGQMSLSKTEVGKYEHFISTMFGYNTKDKRPWSLSEVNEAAANVPKMFKTPYTDIIPLLRDTKFDDGLLQRVLPNKTNFLEFLKNVREFATRNKVLADSILDGGVVIEYENLAKLLDLYTKNYDVSETKDQTIYNLATNRGMRNFARADQMFESYLEERLKIWHGEANQMTLSKIQKKYGAFYEYDEAGIAQKIKENRESKTERTWNKEEKAYLREENRIGPNIQNRIAFLRDEYYQVSDYLSSRIEDIGAMMLIRHKTDQAGITDADSHAIASRIPSEKLSAALVKNFASPEGAAQLKPSLLDLVKMIKYSQEMFHKKEWTKNELGLSIDKFGKELVYSAQEAMNLASTADEHVRNITARINEARSQRGEAPVSSSDMQDLYESLLVSSVMKGGGRKTTGQQMFGLNAVSNEIIAQYARTMGDVYRQSQKSAGEVDIKKMFRAIKKADPKETVLEQEPEVAEKGAPPVAPAEKTEPNAQAESQESKKEPRVVKILGHFKSRMESGGMDPRTNTSLSKKEQKIADPIWKFIEANKSQFKTFQDVIDLFNDMVTSGKHNPNQWALSDIEGLSNHLARFTRYNTVFGTLADLSSPGDEHAVNWMTWMSLPITNARRIMGLDESFYIQHKRIFGTDGVLDPHSETKTYQDDEGVLHKVYADAAIPMNVLLRNLNAHTSMDYLQGEIGKKADEFFERIFAFLHGGVKVHAPEPGSGLKAGEDVTDFIREYSILGREAEGAALDGDSLAESEFNKRKALLEEKWASLKDAKVRIRENGVDSVMTGEQVTQRIRQALEELSQEYRKFIVMDDADIKHYFALNKEGGIDLRETSKRFDGLLNARKVDRIASYDTMAFFNYLMSIDHFAGEALKTHVQRSMSDIESLSAYKGVEKMRSLLPFISSAEKAKLYLKTYDAAMRRRGDPVFDVASLPDPNDIFRIAKYHAEVDKLRRGEIEKDSTVAPTDHMEVVKDLRRYFSARISDTDIRHRLGSGYFKDKKIYSVITDGQGIEHTNFSQYELDKAASRTVGGISPKEYYTQNLMNEYQFRETELISGWFPHRNFDPAKLEEHLKRNYDEARATEPMSVPDQERFLAVQNTIRMMQGETKDPESTDNGKMYDALLSKTGYAPLEHIISSSPNALKSRTANFDGYSMNPYEMRMAIMSAQRSGLAKLTATLNNDAILKFEARQGRLVNGVPAVDPKVTKPWVEYLRHMERQAFNRPSIFTNEMLNNPLVRIKWTTAYWFSDHAMLVNKTSMLNEWYRTLTKADAVTDLDKVIFERRNGREMTALEEQALVDAKTERFMDFSTDANGEFTPKALKNMETAAQMFKRFSQFEAKIELSSLLFHTKFAVANVYGGVMNDYIYNGFAPLRQGRDIKYWNAINSNWKTMADVDRFFEDSGVIESIILKDTGYTVDEGASKKVMDKITEKSSYFMRKTETYLRREAAKHGYISARESLGEMGDMRYDSEYLLSMARHSVEATQFLYNNHNRPAFMATNLGKVFTRFKLWGMNSFRMQGDILNAAADQGFKKGSPEMAKFQRMMTANMFMFGLALMFPHTIFQSQLPQPIDSMAQLSGVFFGDDEKNKAKRKNLMTRMDDPIRDMVEMPTKIPGISFPFARVPLAVYDTPAMFRTIWSHDIHDFATATTMNIMPFGRMTKDVLQAYQSPSMAAELLAGVPLHRIDTFYTKAKKAQMTVEMLEKSKKSLLGDEQNDNNELGRMR